MNWIHRFGPGVSDEPPSRDVLGGKGHSLATMSRAGFHVPPGFVIATECCRAYFGSGRQWPAGLREELDRALQWLKNAAGTDPLLVAVRSGAAVSMPGMMDTILNVAPQGVARAVDAVFESWNSERALHFRARQNIRGLAGTAVVIQAMFPSQQSGVMFTEDPNRPDAGRIVIEAARGLGESVVQGRVDPDVYVVDRARLAVLEKRGSALSDDRIVELARLGLEVEKHVGAPVDVEWGLADGRLALLQSRRIAGLEVTRAIPRLRQEEIDRLRGRSSVWTLSNLSETLAAPTPLTWDIIGRRLMGRGLLRLYRDLGYRPSDRVARDGFLELIAGRIYADLDRSAELFFGGLPLEYDRTAAGADLLMARPTRFNIERAGVLFLLRLPYTIFEMVRAARILGRTARTGLDDLERRVLPELGAALERFERINLKELSDEAVLAELDARERAALEEFGAELLKPGFLAAHFHGRLAASLEEIFGTAEGRALAARLLMGLDGDATVELNAALFEVARGSRAWESFRAEYGHRAVNEFELAEPRWSEDDAYPRRRIEQIRKTGGPSPAELHEKKKQERLAVEATLGRRLREAGAGSLEREIRSDLAGAQRAMPYRETCKHHFMRGLALVRRAIETLAERWNLGRDIYFLRRDELSLYPREAARLGEEIRARKLRWEAFQRLPARAVIASDSLDALGRQEEIAAGSDAFDGIGVSAGVGTGPARLLTSPEEAGDLAPGSVLVCPTTDPAWTPLMVHAAGLVVEHGGMLSHGAIVARDFGIPAVVLANATRLIPEGRRVRVDGNRGRVELV